MTKECLIYFIVGSILSSIATYQYLVYQNYYKINHTDSGDFILKGTKIYDITELKVQSFSK